MDKSLESVLSTITSNTDLMSKISEALFREPDFATSTAYFICSILITIRPSVMNCNHYTMFLCELQYFFRLCEILTTNLPE